MAAVTICSDSGSPKINLCDNFQNQRLVLLLYHTPYSVWYFVWLGLDLSFICSWGSSLLYGAVVCSSLLLHSIHEHATIYPFYYGGHLAYFQSFTSTNSAAMNIPFMWLGSHCCWGWNFWVIEYASVQFW